MRTAYPNELMHYGVQGMKWGVRRYQNLDGTLTSEGKERYSSDSKKSTIETIAERGNLNRREAYVCQKIGKYMYDKAKKVEPKITKNVKEAVANAGGQMYGLSHRLKTAESIAAKVGADSKEKGINFYDSSLGINDVIRYTAILNTSDFVKQYSSIKSDLKKSGFNEVKCKNYFDLYDQGLVMHKSVQSVFKNKDGNKFELQFQTKQSQKAKDLKLPLYNEVRLSSVTPARKKEIEAKMRELAEAVQTPPGIEKIKSK